MAELFTLDAGIFLLAYIAVGIAFAQIISADDERKLLWIVLWPALYLVIGTVLLAAAIYEWLDSKK